MRCPFGRCLGARRSDWIAIALWAAASSALAVTPDYDSFSEPDGEIATTAQEIAAWKMLRDPEQLDAVYADAVKGTPRAVHVVQQLEATLSASGREVAERTSRPGCLVPGYKELSAACRPDWSFLDFLSKNRPGGVRLREVIFGAFAARARERGIENQAILSVVTGLLSVEMARGALLEARVGAARSKGGGTPPAQAAGGLRRGVENKATFKSFNEARDAARKLAGLGDDAIPFVNEVGPLKGRVTGSMSPDGLRGWRLDFDSQEGFHVNWWDRTAGAKRASWLYGSNSVPGKSYEDFQQLLEHGFPKP